MQETIDLARRIVDLISDVKGENILLMDLRDITHIADYFVICTGNSDRQLKAIIAKITEELKKEGYTRLARTEGVAENGWVLVDYGDVVVHAFLEEQREYYDLEGLWSHAKTLLRMQ